MAQLPRVRQTGLIIEELPDEVLVYDLDRNKALCLNHTAATVWKHCDGKTTPNRMAHFVEKELDITVGDEVVSLALDRLAKSHLLTGNSRMHLPKVSRRQLVRGLGVAAAVPIITMILVPTARAQGSCKQDESGCELNSECCSGCCVNATCVPPGVCIG